jgi:phospholipid/cholesterol/gamma-HCH transport system substrate-binding protein
MTPATTVTARRALLMVLTSAALSGSVTGCGVEPNDLFPLPGRHGNGSDAIVITVELANAQTLVRDAEVKVDDVTVGGIRNIRLEGWHAALTVGLDRGTALPANTHARIAQKSLLGAEYLELAPPDGQPPTGRLNDGDVVPLARTGRYPETEEVLAALSSVLNGGGLGEIKTITTELNAALGGNEPKARKLLGTLGTLVAGLDAQRAGIARAITGLDRLAEQLNSRREPLTRAIDTIPAGVAVLNDQRAELVRTLDALSELSDRANRVLEGSEDDLLANLRDLQPAATKLADADRNLTDSVSLLATFPFPSDTSFPSVIKGDYGNLFLTVDVSADNLARNLGAGELPPGAMLTGKLPPLAPGLATPRVGLPALPALPAKPVVPPAVTHAPRVELPGLLSGGR